MAIDQALNSRSWGLIDALALLRSAQTGFEASRLPVGLIWLVIDSVYFGDGAN